MGLAWRYIDQLLERVGAEEAARWLSEETGHSSRAVPDAGMHRYNVMRACRVLRRSYPTTMRAPQVPQRSTPSRASSRSDFARRPRETRHPLHGLATFPRRRSPRARPSFTSLAEPELAEHDPRREQRLHAVERPLDPVLAQVLAHVHHRRAAGAEPERVATDVRLLRVRLEACRRRAGGSRAARSGTAARRASTARRFASAVRSAVTRRWYSATSPSIVDGQPPGRPCPRAPRRRRRRGSRRRPLDPLDDLVLHGERADEPVEVRDDDHVGVAASTSSTARRSPGGCASGVPPDTSSSSIVSTSFKPVALRDRLDTLALLSWRHEPLAVAVADARDADDADGPTNGGRLGQSKRDTRTDFTLTSDSGEAVTLSSLRGHRSYCIFTPRTTRLVVPRRRAGSGTRGRSSRPRAPSCSV